MCYTNISRKPRYKISKTHVYLGFWDVDTSGFADEISIKYNQ